MSPKRKDKQAEEPEAIMGEPEELEDGPYGVEDGLYGVETEPEEHVIYDHPSSYCYTKEYMESIIRKLMYSNESQGALKLTDLRLIYLGGSATISIPIKAITDVTVKCFPWYHTYATSNYLRVDTIVKGKPTFFAFVPMNHILTTVMTINDNIDAYYNKIHYMKREMAANAALAKEKKKGKNIVSYQDKK